MFGVTPFNRNQLSKSNRGDYMDIFNLMDDFFSDSLPTSRGLRSDTFKLDVRDEADAYIVEAELPGFTKEEISIDMNEDILSISASKSEDNESNTGNYIHRERKMSSVKRSIYLKDIDTERIKANFENGLLSITTPKQVIEKKGKVIDIE